MKYSLVIMASFFLSQYIHAGWADHSPESINGFSNPLSDVHHNSGGRRIVRIRNTVIAICPQSGGEYTYRKIDGENTWTEIDRDGSYSGSLITGPDSMVYHFYVQRSGTTVTTIHMVKFKYNEAPPSPVTIHTPNTSSTVLSQSGQYHMLNAVVDSAGILYVATHWGTPDQIYVLRSLDKGVSWQGPFQISDNTASSWFYVHLEFDAGNRFFCTYKEWNADTIKFARSDNRGNTWTTFELPGIAWNLQYHNPALLTYGKDTAFVFAQRLNTGLYWIMTPNAGTTWSEWKEIERTAGYADPSAGIASDGSIYVAFRSDLNRTTADYRSKIVHSSNMGISWKGVDSFYTAPTLVGTRSQIRYQTWWNYGGPLEWIWVQRNAGTDGSATYYDINTDVQIKNMRDTTRTNPTDLIHQKYSIDKMGLTANTSPKYNKKYNLAGQPKTAKLTKNGAFYW